MRFNMSKHTYSVQDLIDAVQDSRSISQVLTKLGMIPAGGNYRTVNRRIAKHNIDISHFSGQGWNKGNYIGPKRPIEYYLKKNSVVQSFKLKKRLISENIFERKCYNCKQTTWLEKDIPLELHHIDGDHSNNELSNLTLLCPNCHALTDNYRGKNK